MKRSLVSVVILAASPGLFAQTSSSMRITSQGDRLRAVVEQVDVRKAVSELARAAGVKIHLDRNVHGIVTFSAPPCKLEVVLIHLVRQVDCVYAVDSGGAYRIFRKPEDLAPAGLLPSLPEEPHRSVPLVTDGDVLAVLLSMFGTAGVGYRVEPGLAGEVHLPKGLSFSEGLEQVLKQVHGQYRIENGVFILGPLR